MTPSVVGLISIAAIILLIQAGMHVAVALLLVSFVGVGLIKGDFTIAGKVMAQAASESIANYSFGTIPLFVVMGLLVGISGIGRDTFDVAGQLFRIFRGGLGMGTVAANAIFAAVNGTSIASASVFTRIAVPELMRLGYAPRFAVGVVAGSSVLGMLIPPSLLLILFGIVAETSIGDLFTAGIVPGLLLSFIYCALIAVLVRAAPHMIELKPGASTQQRELMGTPEMLAKSTPVLLLVLVVLGGIYGGVFTPIEAGAVGALCALLLALYRRALTGSSLGQVLTETGYVTAAISFLLVAAHLYATMLALSGMPNVITEWVQVQGFGFWTVLLGYFIIVLLLGTILDSGSIILIVVPLTLPLMQAFGADVVWFGIVTIIAVEIGLLTPPLGVACFVVKANLPDPRITVGDVFAGAFPFVLAMLFVLALVTAFPWLALGLVR